MAPPARDKRNFPLSLAPTSGAAGTGRTPEAQRMPDSDPPPPSRLTLDDTQLLAALRDGDARAASAFHDRVRPQVSRTIARLLGRRDADGEDLSQLAMIELVTTIDRFRGDCSLDSWTSTVTARVIFKHIRRRQTERRIFSAGAGGEVDEVMPVSSRHGGREVMLRSVMRRVRKHLDAMDENKAWTFLLHDVCGYDLQEIAEITGVSTSAAQTRLTRGRRELHERIGADPELANLMEELEPMP